MAAGVVVAVVRPESTPIHVQARTQCRQERLSARGFSSYDAYLNSPTWRGIKRRYYASGRPWECPCGVVSNLHLHHLTYDRVGGDELLDDLQPLCADCHQTAHALERRGDIGLELTGLFNSKEGQRNLRERLERERDARTEQQVAQAELPVIEAITIGNAVKALIEADDWPRDIWQTMRRIRHCAIVLLHRASKQLETARGSAGIEP
jgi:hypothetical protein